MKAETRKLIESAVMSLNLAIIEAVREGITVTFDMSELKNDNGAFSHIVNVHFED